MGVIPIVDESKIKSPVEIDIPDDKVAGSILGLYETYWKDYLKKRTITQILMKCVESAR